MDVAAGRERAGARARDDDAADLVVLHRAHHGLVQLRAQLAIHRVELLGAVHGEDRDPLALLDEHVVEREAVFRKELTEAAIPCELHENNGAEGMVAIGYETELWLQHDEDANRAAMLCIARAA